MTKNSTQNHVRVQMNAQIRKVYFVSMEHVGCLGSNYFNSLVQFNSIVNLILSSIDLKKLGSCYSKYTHYSFTGKKCVNKKHEKEECSFSVECLEPMACVNKICQCNRFEYFNEIKCINKTLVNSPCQTDNTCHVDLGL